MDVVPSEHAIRRYNERVKPALGLGRCRRELLALAQAAPFQVADPLQRNAPDREGEPLPDPDGYLELAPAIWGVVSIGRGGVFHIITVLVNRSCSTPRRKRRNEAKAKMRRARQRRRKSYVFMGGERRNRLEAWR